MKSCKSSGRASRLYLKLVHSWPEDDAWWIRTLYHINLWGGVVVMIFQHVYLFKNGFEFESLIGCYATLLAQAQVI